MWFKNQHSASSTAPAGLGAPCPRGASSSVLRADVQDQTRGLFRKQPTFSPVSGSLAQALRWWRGQFLHGRAGLAGQLAGGSGFGRRHTEESELTGRRPHAQQWDGNRGEQGQMRNVEMTKPPSELSRSGQGPSVPGGTAPGGGLAPPARPPSGCSQTLTRSCPPFRP